MLHQYRATFWLVKSIPLAYFGQFWLKFWAVSKKVAGRSIYTVTGYTPNSRNIFFDIKRVFQNNIGCRGGLKKFWYQYSQIFKLSFFSINVEGPQNHVFWLYNILTFFHKSKMLGNNFWMIFLKFLQIFLLKKSKTTNSKILFIFCEFRQNFWICCFWFFQQKKFAKILEISLKNYSPTF